MLDLLLMSQYVPLMVAISLYRNFPDSCRTSIFSWPLCARARAARHKILGLQSGIDSIFLSLSTPKLVLRL